MHLSARSGQRPRDRPAGAQIDGPFGAYYAACQSYDADGPKETFAIICLVKWNPGARSGEEFGYKDMTETMGPYHYDCPASILDLLGPPGNEYAANWREACRARLALTSRRKPRPGDMLVLAEPLTFTDGQSRTQLPGGSVREEDGAAPGQRRDRGVKISKLMSRAWTIVPLPLRHRRP
jgi:hypothetical protein